MTTLKVAQFIEKRGMEMIAILAVLMVLFSGWIFYAYAFSSADGSESLEFDGLILKENALENVIQDLDQKEVELNKLKSNPIFSRNIFN